jgi:hypothetical protein
MNRLKRTFSKLSVLAPLFCILSTITVYAASWTLNTWVKSTGGSIVVRNGSPQTVSNGSVFKSYTTHANVPVIINVNNGYQVSALQINGVSQPLPISNGTTYPMGLTAYPGKTSQSFLITYSILQQYSLTALAGAGGTVNPTSYSPVYLGVQTPPKTFTFTPNSGQFVIGITVAGGYVLNTDYTLVNASTNAPVTLPAEINVKVKVNFNNVNGNATITGSFGGGANAGPSKTVLTGATATLDGSASTGATSYAWTQVSGPATVSIGSASSVKALFNTSGIPLGTYVFKLTINGGTSSSTTSIYVTNSAATSARDLCQNCHAINGIGTTQNVFNNWSSSQHKVNLVMCYTCHVGTNTGSHPGSLISGTVSEQSFNFTSNGKNFCITCHNPSIVTDFAASIHVAPAGANSCSFCHTGGVHNPNTRCVNCHTPGNSFGLPWPPTGLAFHNSYTGTDLCVNCHSLHNPSVVTGGASFPHFSTYSTAQYVTTNISCNNCHTSLVDNSFNIFPANLDWAKSGKANPRSPAYIGPGPYTEANLEASDYKLLGTPLPAKPATTTSQDCVRCHTSTGFINYVTPTNPLDPATAFSDIHAWGTPGDRTREMIACKACHNNTTGFDATFSRRNVGIETDPVFNAGVYNVAAFYGYSSAATKKIIRPKSYANPAGSGMFDSNICIACHTGKAAGDLIKLSVNCTSAPSIACRVGTTGNFWANVDFIDPHNMNTANLMFPDGVRAGYEYLAGTSSSPYHTNIGLGATQGPCVGCHMTSPNKHTFSVLSTASNGVIASITSNLCATCHGSIALPTDAGTLQTKKDGYQAALTVIAAQLAAKGIYYDAVVAPYFFTTANQSQHIFANRTVNWNNSATFQGANLMGAAFNLRLLQPGAGWVHNSLYSKRLLFDTIDYLDDGLQNGSVSIAIQNLGIAQTVKDKAVAYIIPRI